MYSESIKKEITNNVLLVMSNYLDQQTLDILKQELEKQLVSVNIEEISTLPAESESSIDNQNKYFIDLMMIKKKNLCKRTKQAYKSAVERLATLINKPLNKMEESDIDIYLNWYEHHNEINGKKKNEKTTCNNERRYLSAFFNWMCKERFMSYNPVSNIEPYKEIQKPIDYFKPTQIENLREGCKTLRDTALLEVLRSTGARVGEVVSINKDDIDWETGDVLILSEKSNKYRVVYLDEVARYHLKKYLDSRDDDNEALFVQEIKPHDRLHPCGIEYTLKQIAKCSNINCRVYPHKLRKTLGMNLKNAGVNLGDIQDILGHANPDTTARYYAESTPDTLRSIRQRCGS